jgi:hypothetical protein
LQAWKLSFRRASVRLLEPDRDADGPLTPKGSKTLPGSGREASPRLDTRCLSRELHEYRDVLVFAFTEALEPIEPARPQFIPGREEAHSKGVGVQHRFVISLRRRHPHQYSHARVRKRVDLWHHEGRATREPRCLLAQERDALRLSGTQRGCLPIVNLVVVTGHQHHDSISGEEIDQTVLLGEPPAPAPS